MPGAATDTPGVRSTSSSNAKNKSHGASETSSRNCDDIPATVEVTLPVLSIALLVLCSLSYLGGEIFRMQMPDHPLTRFAVSLDLQPETPWEGKDAGGARTMQNQKSMPRPKLEKGKVMPETRYTSGSQVAQGVEAVRNSFHLHIEAGEDESGKPSGSGGECAANASAKASPSESTGVDNEEEHLPAGQHLLVDIKNVDGTFLNSEERLAEAMVELVNESHLTLLSYHCHSLIPSGVSCVGVLLESHVSFHTWPVEGVITLDLFTCGPNSLLPSVKTVERLFAIPQAGAGTYQPPGGKHESYVPREEDYVHPPKMLWSHVLRGFRPPLEGGGYRVLENDVTEYVLSQLDLDHKVEVVSLQSDFQHISIYDVIEPRFGTTQAYERSVRPELGHTYEGRHPELFRPDRKVFLDGVVQSSRHGDEAYHEALVHPGMFAHPHPRRAAIIGGGEGATLREILKHRTVEHVKMIEIDEVMVNVSRQYLPDWSDCSNLVGSAESCFDDPRTDVLYEDALGWFMDRFKYPEGDCDGESLSESERAHCRCDSEDAIIDVNRNEEDSSDDEEEDSSDAEEDNLDKPLVVDGEEKFDVIIMDALDPQDSVAFSEELYSNNAFLESLYGALTDDGVLVMQLGSSPLSVNPAEELGQDRNRAEVMSIIERMGFASMHVYEEAHCGFHFPWSFLVACKSYGCRYRWYASEAKLMYEIQQRVAPTKSGGGPALKYFDGATMKSYQLPPKSWENVFCRKIPQPKECSVYRGLNPKAHNHGVDDFEVKMSSVGDHAGRGMFSKVDILKGSLIMQDQAQHKVHFHPWSTFLINHYLSNMEEAEDLEDLMRYMEGYGYEQEIVATDEYYVDASFLTFVNHGCNGTSNIGDIYYGDQMLNEAVLDPAKDKFPAHLLSSETFSPVRDRHMPSVASGYEQALRDIRAGEELFSNYLFYCASQKGWAKELQSLQEQCRGESLGQIKADETEWEEYKREFVEG